MYTVEEEHPLKRGSIRLFQDFVPRNDILMISVFTGMTKISAVTAGQKLYTDNIIVLICW